MPRLFFGKPQNMLRVFALHDGLPVHNAVVA